MIQKYRFGTPINTDAVVQDIPSAPMDKKDSEENQSILSLAEINAADHFTLTIKMQAQDAVYGLGEANRGINKRGYRYARGFRAEYAFTEPQSTISRSRSEHGFFFAKSPLAAYNYGHGAF